MLGGRRKRERSELARKLMMSENENEVRTSWQCKHKQSILFLRLGVRDVNNGKRISIFLHALSHLIC